MSELQSFAIFYSMARDLRPHDSELPVSQKWARLQRLRSSIREPDIDETPLSQAEIEFAYEIGVLR